MGGGKHKRLNPRGSPSGRKLSGDQLAEKVRGRKGMYDPQREKGPSHKKLESDKEVVIQGLSKDEFQIIWFLHRRDNFCPSELIWDELVRELEVIGMEDASMEADAFLGKLRRKTDGWLKYISLS